MDTIWNCAFGVDIDLQHNPDNEYYKKSEELFNTTWQLRTQNFLGCISSFFKNIYFDDFHFYD
jgi:hypothetical protein